MIQVNIPNMSEQQRRMLNALWKMSEMSEVYDWIQNQPTAALRREAETMKEMLLLAVWDSEMDTKMAKPLLDNILR